MADKFPVQHAERGRHPQRPEPQRRRGVHAGEDAQRQGERGSLGPSRKQRGDRSGSAFVNVRRPKLERRRGDFEGQADENKSEADLQQGVRGIVGKRRHQVEVRRSRGSEGQRDAVKEESRGERSQQKIFHRRFVRARGVALVAGQNVGSDGAHFQADEMRSATRAPRPSRPCRPWQTESARKIRRRRDLRA
jgi:hypothetical protein